MIESDNSNKENSAVPMIFNFKREDQAYPQSLCSLMNLKLDNVESFKYLGCQIQYNQASLDSMELNSRINSAKAAV